MELVRKLGTNLVGRDPERQILRMAVDSARDGAGRCLVIIGSAGMGKTALLDDLERDLDESVMVLRLRGDQLLVDEPYGAIAACLGHDWRVVVAGIGEEREPGHEAAVLERSLDRLVDVSLRRPLVVLADDLQWIDPPSLRILDALVRRASGLALTVIGACRPHEMTETWSTLEAVSLQPLDDVTATHLATAALGPDHARHLEVVVERAKGSPFWIKRLGAIVASSPENSDERLPRTEAAVLTQLRVLGRDGIRALGVAAMVGRRIDVGLVASVLAARTDDVESVLRIAADLGVVSQREGWEFDHDIIREALIRDLPGDFRDEVYMALGSQVSETQPDIAAAYLDRSRNPGPLIGEVLLRAASQSAHLSVPEAAALAERGWRALPAGHGWRLDTAADVVGLLACAGRPGDAIALGIPVIDRGTPPQRARLAIAISAAAEQANQADVALEIIEATVTDELAPGERSHVWAWRARARFWVGDLAGADQAQTRSRELDGADTTVTVVTEALTRAARGDARGAVHAARTQPVHASSDRLLPDTPLDPYGPELILAAVLLGIDDHEAAIETCLEVLDDTARLSVSRQCDALLNIALATYLGGSPADALASAEAAATAALDAGADLHMPLPHALEAYRLRQAGDAASAARAIEAGWLAAAGPGSNTGIEVLASIDMAVAEELGELAGAVERARFVWELAKPMAYLPPWRSMAPAAVRVAGRIDQALVDELVEFAREGARRSPDVASVRAVASRCEGLALADVSKLAQACDDYLLAGRPLDAIECRVECADAALEVDDRVSARFHLDKALRACENRQLPRTEQIIAARLRRLGVRARRVGPAAALGWDALTPTESDVVRLVAAGLTNREVGTRLQMSHRTVETHLTHVFAKLGVRSRVEVAAAHAARQDPKPSGPEISDRVG